MHVTTQPHEGISSNKFPEIQRWIQFYRFLQICNTHLKNKQNGIQRVGCRDQTQNEQRLGFREWWVVSAWTWKAVLSVGRSVGAVARTLERAATWKFEWGTIVCAHRDVGKSWVVKCTRTMYVLGPTQGRENRAAEAFFVAKLCLYQGATLNDSF